MPPIASPLTIETSVDHGEKAFALHLEVEFMFTAFSAPPSVFSSQVRPLEERLDAVSQGLGIAWLEQ